MQVETPLQAVLVGNGGGSGGGAAAASGARSDRITRVAARWWGVARLWWRCPTERRRAWAYTGACVALSLTNVALLLWISYVQNALQSSLSEKKEGERMPGGGGYRAPFASCSGRGTAVPAAAGEPASRCLTPPPCRACCPTLPCLVQTASLRRYETSWW